MHQRTLENRADEPIIGPGWVVETAALDVCGSTQPVEDDGSGNEHVIEELPERGDEESDTYGLLNGERLRREFSEHP